MDVYVDNLSYEVSEEDLKQAFDGFGHVESAKVIKDMYSGRSRGFGFVEMPDEAEAHSAINRMSGKVLKGRSLNVSEARSRFEGRRDGGRTQGGRLGGWRRS
jgi:RNA recognition motif-containing protein